MKDLSVYFGLKARILACMAHTRPDLIVHAIFFRPDELDTIRLVVSPVKKYKGVRATKFTLSVMALQNY